MVPPGVEISLETTTLGGNVRTVYTLISIPKIPYIYAQSGRLFLVRGSTLLYGKSHAVFSQDVDAVFNGGKPSTYDTKMFGETIRMRRQNTS